MLDAISDQTIYNLGTDTKLVTATLSVRGGCVAVTLETLRTAFTPLVIHATLNVLGLPSQMGVRSPLKWGDLGSNRYDFRYGHYHHRYQMVTAHRLLSH